GFALDGVG
uniref:Sperm-activating peptide c n=1 Tax=Pseudoboletia maculata TaxID=31190 RepID=Q7M4C6_PSEMC|nr:sperm-activating peptide I, Des-6,7-Gly (3-Ala,5-Asp) [Pseudoboletia maculata]